MRRRPPFTEEVGYNPQRREGNLELKRITDVRISTTNTDTLFVIDFDGRPSEDQVDLLMNHPGGIVFDTLVGLGYTSNNHIALKDAKTSKIELQQKQDRTWRLTFRYSLKNKTTSI